MSSSKEKEVLHPETRGIVEDLDEDGDAHIQFYGLEGKQWVFRKNLCKLEVETPEQIRAAKVLKAAAKVSVQAAVVQVAEAERNGVQMLLRKFKRCNTRGDGLISHSALERILGSHQSQVLVECLAVMGPSKEGFVRFDDLLDLLFPGEEAEFCYTIHYVGQFSHPTRGEQHFRMELDTPKRGHCMLAGQKEVVSVSRSASRICFDLFGGETRFCGKADRFGAISGGVTVSGQSSGSFRLKPDVSGAELSTYVPRPPSRETQLGTSEDADCPRCRQSLQWIDDIHPPEHHLRLAWGSDGGGGAALNKYWKCEKCNYDSATQGPYHWSCQNCPARVCCRCGPKLIPRLLRELAPLRPVSNYIGIHDWVTMGARSLKRDTGCFYHEVKLGPALNCPQIGWLTSQFELKEVDGLGVGSDEHGWAADGLRHLKWHSGSRPAAWPRDWQSEDIIGCLIDIDAGTMRFSLNGSWVSDASMSFNALGRSFFPAVSMSGDFTFHIAREEWFYPPEECNVEAWAIWGRYRRAYGSVLIMEGARVQVVEEFATDSTPKLDLQKGDYGFIYRMDADGDALIDFNEHPDKREWIFRKHFSKLRVLESQRLEAVPPQISELDKSGRSLLGTWEHSAGQFAITEAEGSGLLFYGEVLQDDGMWMVCTLPATSVSYRLRLSKEGNSLTWQESADSGTTWQVTRFAMRQGQLADGASLITTQQCSIWRSIGSSHVMDTVPTATRLVAAGPKSSTHNCMVPIRPDGAVELRCVRLYSPLDDNDALPASGQDPVLRSENEVSVL